MSLKPTAWVAVICSNPVHGEPHPIYRDPECKWRCLGSTRHPPYVVIQAKDLARHLKGDQVPKAARCPGASHFVPLFVAGRADWHEAQNCYLCRGFNFRPMTQIEQIEYALVPQIFPKTQCVQIHDLRDEPKYYPSWRCNIADVPTHEPKPERKPQTKRNTKKSYQAEYGAYRWQNDSHRRRKKRFDERPSVGAKYKSAAIARKAKAKRKQEGE